MVFFSNLRRSNSDARSGYTAQGAQGAHPTHPPPSAPRSVLRRKQTLDSRQNVSRISSESIPSPPSDVTLAPVYTDLDLDTSRYPPFRRSHPPPSSQPSLADTHKSRKDNIQPTNPYQRSNSSQMAVLISMLAVGSLAIVWDVRDSPVHMRQSRQSRQANDLTAPATSTHSQRICLISHDFPWSIDVAANKSRPLTTLDIVEALYEALDRELRRSEWALASDGQKYAMQKANKIRRHTDSAKRIRRVDWLGSRYMFRGLEKDDNLARRRLMPGDRTDSETWVVRFGSQSP